MNKQTIAILAITAPLTLSAPALAADAEDMAPKNYIPHAQKYPEGNAPGYAEPGNMQKGQADKKDAPPAGSASEGAGEGTAGTAKSTGAPKSKN